MPRLLKQNENLIAEENASAPMQLSVTSDSVVSRGQVTLCYLASEDASRRRLFLKQFKQPGPRLSWYKAYLKYLQELSFRIDSTTCKYLTSRVFSVFEYRDSICEAMEYLRGESLKDYLAGRSFSEITQKEYCTRMQIAVCFMGALRAFHAAGIVHTDLKPDNIFLEEAPGTALGFAVKLIDFDYAIMVDSPSLPWDDEPSLAIAGTQGYFPPEQYTHEKYGKHSDMFTAGVILQELLCSSTPFPKESYDSMVNPSVQSPPPVPPTFPAFLSRQVASVMGAFITQCPSIDKASRPSAEKMHRVLIQFRNAVNSGTTIQSPSAPRPRRPQSGRLLVLQGPSGAMTFNDTTKVSAMQIAHIDSTAASFADRICQFTLRLEGDTFYILPNLSANSIVLVNGKEAEDCQPLEKGDRISLQNADKRSQDMLVDVK